MSPTVPCVSNWKSPADVAVHWKKTSCLGCAVSKPVGHDPAPSPKPSVVIPVLSHAVVPSPAMGIGCAQVFKAQGEAVK